jgi:hypothetical protein
MTGEVLRKIMYVKNIKLSTVADSSGWSRQRFNSMLRANDVKSGVIERIAEVSGVSVAEIYNFAKIIESEDKI